jgi:EAL domain-containing protein (putative c-di-GMP-specific phosphodiesterase class I)
MERVELEADLRRAIEKKEFVLHYQPIIDLESKQMIGMEALVRWNHPIRGIIPPNKFIPVAEETNQIVPLGKWILDEACRQAKIWQTQHSGEPPLSISVNISIRQFQQEALVEMVDAALKKSGLAPETLVLEITESLMLQNTEVTIKKLQELKKLGIRLAIDDFGTGYSSLSYLQRFPLDILKIDKSFIDKISQSKEGIAVARAIIMMSDTLCLKTVAEGIEHADQITALQNLGCGLGQGFHFAKPLNQEDMNAFVLKAIANKKSDWLFDQIMQENGGLTDELAIS